MPQPTGSDHFAARRRRLTPERAEKIAEAMNLRREGQTYEQIAEIFGVSRSTVYHWVQRGIADTLQEPGDALRTFELDRLDLLWQAAWRQLKMNHWLVSHGSVVMDADDQPMIDEQAKLHALDRCLKVQERRAKLLGLDAPTRTQHLTMDAVDAEIQRLTEELARNDPVTAEELLEEEDSVRVR